MYRVDGALLEETLDEVEHPLTTPTTLFSDSKSAIALTQDGHYHACTKHIDIRYHFICYIIEAKNDKMTADTLTKALLNVKAKNFATTLEFEGECWNMGKPGMVATIECC